MENIQFTARFLIHEGKEEEFKSIVAKCIKVVSENEKDTNSQYDWYFNENRKEYVARETYSDSDAVLTHVANLGDLFGGLLQTSDFFLEIYGNPTEALLNAVAGLNHKIYSFYQGL